MIGLLYNAISENMSQKGFLLDGYPRAVDQAIEFEKRIGACKAVLYFNCPLTVLEQRLLERGKTSGRADDNLETIKKRFTTFENQSLPAIEYFGDKVIKISSDAPIDSVYEDCSSRLRAALA